MSELDVIVIHIRAEQAAEYERLFAERELPRTVLVMSVRAALTQGRSALRVLTADTALLPGCPPAVRFLPACPGGGGLKTASHGQA
jgi:hypothetical protein